MRTNCNIYIGILFSFLCFQSNAVDLPGGGNGTTTDKTLEPTTIIVQALKSGSGKDATIEGKVLPYGNVNIVAFQGIQYASQEDDDGNEVEVGRFEDSSLKKYYGIRQSSFINLPAPCPQLARSGIPAVVGKENCLKLNVYTSATLETNAVGAKFKDEKLPVMVYLHGGYYVSGDTSITMPSRLAKEGVILVTVQYRLGPLGFFYTNDDKYNLAIGDQRVALEWVHENIRDFGGDKDRVTLVGEDAGAVSAFYLLWDEQNNKINKHITNGIIAHSGAPIQPFMYNPEPEELTQKIAQSAGCDSKTDYECLIDEKTASDLIMAFNNVMKNNSVTFPFIAPGNDGTFTDSPMHMFTEDFTTDVPIIMGTTKHEGYTTLGALAFTYLYPNNLNEEEYLENDAVDDFLNFAGLSNGSEFVSFATKSAFSYDDVDEYTMENVAPSLIDMTGTLLVKSPVYEMAKLISNTTTVYLYSFEHESKRSSFAGEFWEYDTKQFFDDTKGYYPTAKGDDLMYVLNFPNMNVNDDQKVEENMVSWWTAFAKNGKPSNDWKKFDKENKKYFIISTDSYMTSDYDTRFTATIDGDPPKIETTTMPTGTYTTGTTETTQTTQKSPTESTDATDSTSKTTEAPTNDCQDCEDKRDAYLITMIIFIIAFVIAAGAAIFHGVKKS